jgi:hypothetical protein
MVQLTIHWEDPYGNHVETYSFDSDDKADGFRMGLYESQKWFDYEIIREEVTGGEK